MERLSKVLARAGVASRRACEELIFDGHVSVNGTKTLVPQTSVDLSKDKIVCKGTLIVEEEKKVIYMLNKPRGLVCSSKPMDGKRLVIDLFSDSNLRLFTVGRLDRDTSGLLIVTNDGHFANQVIHPRYNVTKEYLIKAREEITHEHLKSISSGMKIEGTFVKPLKVTKVRRGIVKIALKEGKKHEVRLLVKQANLTLLSLHRIRIGNLHLGALDSGQYRELTQNEQQMLLQKT